MERRNGFQIEIMINEVVAEPQEQVLARRVRELEQPVELVHAALTDRHLERGIHAASLVRRRGPLPTGTLRHPSERR